VNKPTQGIRGRRDGQLRREAILDEAQRIIGECGYHGFGLHELAARCGLTRPGLLHHFGSKDGLLLDLLRHCDMRHERAAVAELGSHHDPLSAPDIQRARLIAGLQTIMARNIAQPELIRLQVILQAEAINHAHPAHDYFKAREATKLTLLAEHAATFSAHPMSTARQIIALWDGLQAQWLREDMTFDLLAEFDSAVASVIR